MMRPKAALFLVLLLLLSACGYKPSYLAREKNAPPLWTSLFGSTEEREARWEVERLAASELNPDERGVFEKWGTPEAILFFRSLEGRKPVYEWVYRNPFRSAFFVDGKQVSTIAVDSETSPLGTRARKIGNRLIVIGGIVVAVVGILAIG
ncbi:MAG: hypothetical protein HYY65_03210 [Candidatus Tectomicrobia bacterium]|uniref:Lipoprotein n=1 Tax=Tectimicrobiota bacterium TaxID=2528274 RepID=A0A932LZY0_UNCTE|nr:hypothetical protein [Candidatus Tectomicrobia bacterium]